MTNSFSKLYDEIESLRSDITEYATENLLAGDVKAETKVRIEKVRDAMSILKDAAHELNEHLAWDK